MVNLLPLWRINNGDMERSGLVNLCDMTHMGQPIWTLRFSGDGSWLTAHGFVSIICVMAQEELAEFIYGDGSPSTGFVEALARIGFSDPESAARVFRRLTVDPRQRAVFLAFTPHLFEALSGAGSPDWVLSTFERFIHGAQDALSMVTFLENRPRAVEMLVRLFSGSHYLAEILLRSPEFLENLLEPRRLAQIKNREQYYREARSAVGPEDTPVEQLDALRRFQRGELLRIGACDLLDLYDLPTATMQLARLADSMVQVGLEIVAQRLQLPGEAARSGPDRASGWPRGFAVIGMGKLGGEELNYSSDIDLLFLTDVSSPTMTRVGEQLIDALARVTTEGFLYRVDMRLRPWGKVGPLVSSVDGFISYLTRHSLQWEKQSLIKARVIAGDRMLGETFLRRTRPIIFEGETETVRADVFAMKQRTEAFVQQKGRSWGDVKLGEGSIRDAEFVVQFLQLANGKQYPEILSSNTLKGLSRCAAAGFITPSEQRILSDGYIFLRTIEHHLQMLDYRQTHTLPEDPEAIASLARRLGFEGQRAGEKFLARYRQHSAAIREIYMRYVGRIGMTNHSPDPLPQAESGTPTGAASDLDINRHLARMNPIYGERFSESEISRHTGLAGQLSDQLLSVVDAQPNRDGSWEVTIIAYDYPGELSLICGLMFVHGLDIVKGDVFTYEPLASTDSGDSAVVDRSMARGRRKTRLLPPTGDDQVRRGDARRKIVDVFTVRAVRSAQPGAELWQRYAHDLEELLHMMRSGQRQEAHGLLARRVGASMFAAGQSAQVDEAAALLPLQIEIDNQADANYTVLRIDTPDTTGFLYEFTNSLALNHVYIARVSVSSVGTRVSDTVYITDENGQKINHPERQRELRAATVLIKHFTHLLPYSPNPESALLHFREFLAQLFKRPNWPDELGSLERPEVLQSLARLLGVSDFLWDDFLRMQYANLYPVVTGVDALDTAKTRDQLQAELEAILAEVHAGPQPPADDAPWRIALNDFKDREMLRIDMRHILGHTKEFWDFAAELTDLAEVVVNAAYHLCHEDLRIVYGTPRLENPDGSLGDVCEMSVCALGKCGGRELGFASDIELMFVYSGTGKTTGPQVITSAAFYEKLVQHFVRSIRARREGVFEIDLQLRPYGKAGSLSVSLDAFRRYFAPEGPAWPYERQALVKLRPIAGNPGLGQSISALRDSFVYTGEPFDSTAMRAMRERQVRHLVTAGMYNLKYSPGGLVDVEYLVQGLQITYGNEYPELRQPNTREALAALAEVNILSADDYVRLRKAHTFLRWAIDALRVVRGNARDVTVPPESSEEFAFLTRRIRYGADTARLSEELIRYTTDVQEINKRMLT